MRLRLNITAKLLGYLLLASIVPLVVLGFSALEIARRVVLEQAQAENVHLVGGFASYLTLYDGQIEDLATNIAGNDAIGSSLQAADTPDGSSFDALNLRAQIGYALNAYIRVKGLVSLDLFSTGGEHFHVGETLAMTPVAAQTAASLMRDAQAAQESTLWRGVGENINSNSRYKQVRSVVRTIRHFSPATGKTDTVGVLVISLTDEIMQEYLSRAPLTAGQKLMLVDKNGRISLHSNHEMVGQTLSPELLELVRNGRETKHFRLDGRDVLMDATPTGISHSHAVMLTPLELVTNKVNQLTMATLTLLTLCLLAVAALTWRYARTVVAPIRSVSEGFHLIHVQPEAEPAPLPRPLADDEIAQLVDGYNQHIVTLREQKQVRADLLHARQSAEAASRAKSDFLANMSHEIRTPMNAILGLLKLMHGTSMNERQKDYVSKTEGAATSLLGLLNDILDFSKVEAGKMTLDPRPFSLQKMLDDLAVVLSANMRGKGIEVRFDVGTDVPKYLLADDMRLQQVLVNLGGNAIKFTNEGEVVVRVRSVESSLDSALLEFSVVDTGIGIAPEKQSLIFSDFSQAESSTTRRFGGTGLGLSISRRLVELMGSQLCLHSELGKGSTFLFTVRMPIVDRSALLNLEERHADRGKVPSKRLNGVRVLLVEDNQINQMVADGLLGQEGALVTLADNGQLGIEALQKTQVPFDVVLMDLQMPVMDGFEATSAIRSQPEYASLPIIAMTANAMPSDREACLAAGMNDHIGKPFDLNRLVAMLKHYVKHPSLEHEPEIDARIETPTSAMTTADSSLNESLPLQTVDMQAALERMGGNEALLCKALESVIRNARTLPVRVGESLSAGNLPQAARELHTFKGLSATVGALSLSKAISELENQVKSGSANDDHVLLLQMLEEALSVALPALEHALEIHAHADLPTRAQDLGAPNAGEVDEALKELEQLLQDADMAALPKMDQIRLRYMTTLGPAVNDLSIAIGNLDFSAAVHLCQALRSERASP